MPSVAQGSAGDAAAGSRSPDQWTEREPPPYRSPQATVTAWLLWASLHWHGAPPTDEELAARLSLSVATIARHRRDLRRTIPAALTRTQQQIVDAIDAHVERTGQSPSLTQLEAMTETSRKTVIAARKKWREMRKA